MTFTFTDMCFPNIPPTNSSCLYFTEEITEKKCHSTYFRLSDGLNSTTEKQLILFCTLQPEPAAIYLLLCIMLTLSEAIALISSVYYCTH